MNETSTGARDDLQPKRHRDYLGFGVFGAGVLMMLLAGVLAFPQTVRMFREASSVRALSKITPHAEFLSDIASTTTIYTIEGGKYESQPSEGLVISSTDTSQGTVRIVRLLDGTYEVRQGDQVLHHSPSALTGLDASSDGRYLTFSAQSESASSTPVTASLINLLPLETNNWSVIVLNVATRTTYNLGAGVQPFFTDETHVVRTTPVGIYATSITTGESVELLSTPLPRVGITALVSPDHVHMGIAVPARKSVTVYKISANAAQEVISIPLPENIMSYTLGNNELYMLRTAMFGTEIWKQPLDSTYGTSITLIPGSLHISRMNIK